MLLVLRPRGHEPVESEPGEERAHDPLEAHAIREKRGGGERREQEEEGRHRALAEMRERPAADPRQEERAIEREHDEPEEQLHEDHRGAIVALDRAHDDREDEERERVGDHGPAARHPDGAMSRQLVLLDDRIRDQGVRRPQRPVEGCGREPVPERKDEEQAEDEGQREGECAEGESRFAVALELVEVELEPREKHEKEQPELAQRLDDALAMNPVEDERPHQHPAQHDPDEAREPEALGDHGSGEQHDGSHEERPFGGHRRELDGQRHTVSLNAATDGLRAQKISGHHGARSAANIASARAAAPRRSSSIRPPRDELREGEAAEVARAERAHVAADLRR